VSFRTLFTKIVSSDVFSDDIYIVTIHKSVIWSTNKKPAVFWRVYCFI